MKQKYNDYIKEITYKEAYGYCEKQVEKMKEKFPELIPTKGWYYDAIWNEEREHHWLKTTDSEIIDPTAKQFPTVGMINFYREYKEGDLVRFGVCANCGEDIMGLPEDYTNDTVCSEECHNAYVNYINGNMI